MTSLTERKKGQAQAVGIWEGKGVPLGDGLGLRSPSRAPTHVHPAPKSYTTRTRPVGGSLTDKAVGCVLRVHTKGEPMKTSPRSRKKDKPGDCLKGGRGGRQAASGAPTTPATNSVWWPPFGGRFTPRRVCARPCFNARPQKRVPRLPREDATVHRDARRSREASVSPS